MCASALPLFVARFVHTASFYIHGSCVRMTAFKIASTSYLLIHIMSMWKKIVLSTVKMAVFFFHEKNMGRKDWIGSESHFDSIWASSLTHSVLMKGDATFIITCETITSFPKLFISNTRVKEIILGPSFFSFFLPFSRVKPSHSHKLIRINICPSRLLNTVWFNMILMVS